mmetsp:Transcript_141891/g.353648  ORF Transcript_141891/g.353648 Transcript_141891/m.353648 type:complete len:237 (+) Transcript_141891:104-814(+)
MVSGMGGLERRRRHLQAPRPSLGDARLVPQAGAYPTRKHQHAATQYRGQAYKSAPGCALLPRACPAPRLLEDREGIGKRFNTGWSLGLWRCLRICLHCNELTRLHCLHCTELRLRCLSGAMLDQLKKAQDLSVQAMTLFFPSSRFSCALHVLDPVHVQLCLQALDLRISRKIFAETLQNSNVLLMIGLQQLRAHLLIEARHASLQSCGLGVQLVKLGPQMDTQLSHHVLKFAMGRR